MKAEASDRLEGFRRVAEALAQRSHPNGVFRLSPAQLETLTLTGAPVCDVTP